MSLPKAVNGAIVRIAGLFVGCAIVLSDIIMGRQEFRHFRRGFAHYGSPTEKK